MAEHINVMLSEEEINSRIAELGEQISRDYEGKEIFLICILKGASFLACELAQRITVPVNIDFMKVSSYGGGTVSSGQVSIKMDVSESIAGKEVLIVEDIIDSGNTLNLLPKILMERGPKSIRLCALLDKPDRREVDVKMNYVGFRIPDKFVVGYGLDYDQRYRNLPYIGEVVFD